jgi:hypothetical protein
MQRIPELQKLINSNPTSKSLQAWKTELASLQRKHASSMLTPKAKAVTENIISSVEIENRRDFVKTLIYPDQYSHRIPDDLTQPTNLYRSLREFALVANMDGTVNAGKFSFAVKPILGSSDAVNHFQVGIVDNTTGWPSDFTDPNSYVSDNLSSNPKRDPMILPLLAPAPGQYVTTFYQPGDLSGNTGFPFGTTATTWPGSTVTIKESNLDLYTSFYPTLNVTSTPLQPSYVANNVTLFHLSSGCYNINPWFHVLGTWNAVSVVPMVLDVVAVDSQLNVVGHITFHRAAADEFTGVFKQGVNVDIINDWSANLLAVGQSLIMDINFNLVTDEKYSYGLIMKFGANPTNIVSGVIINTAVDDTLPFTSNSGSIIKLRPVALSALVTCTLPELTAGGNIIGYSAPPGDIDGYYYKTSSTMGPYQDWQNLARNNKGLCTHDGNFKDGTYVWTQPWEVNDTLMRTPTESLEYPYHGIIVSGQVNPTVNLSGLVEIGRIRIAILFEYTTDSRLFNPEPCYGTPMDLSWCLNFLASQQHATENKDHLKNLKRIVSGAAAWITRSVPAMKQGLDLASGIAKIIL